MGQAKGPKSKMEAYAEFVRLQDSGLRDAIRKLADALADTTLMDEENSDVSFERLMGYAMDAGRPTSVRAMGKAPRHVHPAVRTWLTLAAAHVHSPRLIERSLNLPKRADPTYEPDSDALLDAVEAVGAAAWRWSILLDRDKGADHEPERWSEPAPVDAVPVSVTRMAEARTPRMVGDAGKYPGEG